MFMFWQFCPLVNIKGICPPIFNFFFFIHKMKHYVCRNLCENFRDAPIVLVSVVSAISQDNGTLKFSPILADTDTFILFSREIATNKKYLRTI